MSRLARGGEEKNVQLHEVGRLLYHLWSFHLGRQRAMRPCDGVFSAPWEEDEHV
jgi:hypothetical protein